MDNIINQPKSGALVCRKCNGPHLTIKCGKDKKEEVIDIPKSFVKKTYAELRKEKMSKENNDTTDEEQNSVAIPKLNKVDYNEFIERDRIRKPSFKTTYRVKLSNLPVDMTEEELMEMTCDWGHIIRIKLLVYEESAIAYIDFGYEDEANYFIEAIDKTPFEYLILSASKAEQYKD